MGDRTSGWIRWAGLVGWLALAFTAAFFGAQFTAPDWYQQLDRPSWSPPSSLFGPVWTLLYILMGISAWLVWQEGVRRDVRAALTLFVVQLIPNAAWSWLFFGLRRPDLALIDIVVLWLLIAATIAVFYRAHRLAALMLVPYILWVTFATALNFRLWQLNG
jgi:translocator protein